MTARRVPLLLACGVPVALMLLLPGIAHAQSVSIDLGASGAAGATGRLVQLTALITVLALAPSLLVMVTAFTRIVIVLSPCLVVVSAFGIASAFKFGLMQFQLESKALYSARDYFSTPDFFRHLAW